MESAPPNDKANPRSREEWVAYLKELTTKLRVDIIEMLTEAGSGHPGGSLSAVDIIAALYKYKMNYRPEEPDWTVRDRFVLSKGHGCPALYAVMAEVGYFSGEKLFSLRKTGSPVQGHPACQLLPGVEASTGSLGQGLSVAQGLALASRLDGDSFQVYCMIGDGETQEGQIWEVGLSAAHFKLDNLVVFLDYNKGQIDGYVKDVMNLEPVVEKWKAFGWNTHEIDGHDFSQILDVLDQVDDKNGRPTMVVAHTIKGKGVSFMEDKSEWHGKAPTAEEAKQAISEILRGGA